MLLPVQPLWGRIPDAAAGESDAASSINPPGKETDMDAKELERFVNDYVKALNSQNVDEIEKYHADNSETVSASRGQRASGRSGSSQ